MLRGKIYHEDYRPQLSGHETFPLRYGWLKKAFDAVASTENEDNNKSVFLDDSAIARFGVGRNMVTSMRHWATVSGIISEPVDSSNNIVTTNLGRRLLGSDGLDPYFENPSSLWLVHWFLAGKAERTTWHWAFNYYPGISFDRDGMVRSITRIAEERGWRRTSPATIKRDVECFVRTYVSKDISGKLSPEEAIECPLAELGLIKATGKRDGFRFVRGPKLNLGRAVFLYGLLDFWDDFSTAKTLSFEAVAHEPGSPGRVFLLDENEVADRLQELEEFTGGAIRWSETAGLKQVVAKKTLKKVDRLSLLEQDYRRCQKSEAA